MITMMFLTTMMMATIMMVPLEVDYDDGVGGDDDYAGCLAHIFA